MPKTWSDSGGKRPLVLPEKTRVPLPPAAPLAELRTAARVQPEVPDVHIELAAALVRARAYDEAEAAYRRALQLDADAAQAYVGLGKLYADRGGTRAGDRRTATSGRARQHLGRAALRAGQHSLASTAFGRGRAVSMSAPSPYRRTISKPISTWLAYTLGRPITARP